MVKQKNSFSGNICRVSFYGNNRVINHTETTSDLLLFFIISGEATLEIQGKIEEDICLKKDDIIIINPEDEYRFVNIEGIVAEISFYHEDIYRLLDGKRRIVDCNSARIRNGSLDGLISLVKRLFGAAFRNDLGIVAFEKISYDILLTLLSEYSVEIIDDDRKSSVKNWIDNVLKEPISLEEAAEHFGLTQQYFSRWFKETFEISFLKYVSKKRCENACNDLLKTDNTILKIALDNGFPNSASFTNTFAKLYGCSPITFRKNNTSSISDIDIDVEDILSNAIKSEYVDDSSESVLIEYPARYTQLEPYWNSICNFGSITKLENYDVQNQLRLLQKSLRFQNARIVLDQKDWSSNSGFYLENRIIEFLFEIGIKPIFVIDYRTCINSQDFFGWLNGFFKHISQKYGFKKIYIEVLYDTLFNKLKSKDYNSFVNDIRNMAAGMKLSAIIIGPGLLLSPDGNNLSQFINYNRDIDIISIRCIPIEVFDGKEYSVRIMSDDDYVIHQYSLAQKIMEEAGVDKKILITSMANSFLEKDRLNDSSWMAARLLRTAINGYGLLPSLPIEYPLDIMKKSGNDETFFDGNSGIITSNELKKPAFYSYQFLMHLDENLLYKDEHMIVTESTNGYFQIVVQNCCPLSYEYYLNGFEGKNQLIKDEEMFESKNPYLTTITIKNLPDGQWFMKVRRVNEQKGNVYDAFKKMNYTDSSFVGLDEMDYLRLSSCPDMSGIELKSQGGKLVIPIKLDPNEIQHIHLIPRR